MKARLSAPYVLSFCTLTHFDCLLLEVELEDGQVLAGEVVPLAGYLDEEIEDVERDVAGLIEQTSGLPVEAALSAARDAESPSITARSLFLMTLEARRVLVESGAVPVVAAAASDDPRLDDTLSRHLQAGFRTIKVKVIGDSKADLDAIEKLQRQMTPDCLLRFDANQAFTFDQAIRFSEVAADRFGDRIEYLEQPFRTANWADHERFVEQSPLPLMLDESILSDEDVHRAASIGCRFIKLKIYKTLGVENTVRLAQMARGLGIRVVFGNGVATDISNLVELSTCMRYPDLFHGASESVGYAKLAEPLRYPDLHLENGTAIWHSSPKKETKQ